MEIIIVAIFLHYERKASTTLANTSKKTNLKENTAKTLLNVIQINACQIFKGVIKDMDFKWLRLYMNLDTGESLHFATKRPPGAIFQFI